MKDISFWPPDDKRTRVASVYQRTAGCLRKSQNPNTMSSTVYFMESGGLIAQRGTI